MVSKRLLLKFIKHVPPYELKNILLRKLLGYSIGKNVRIGKAIINCKKVVIGDNVFIANNNVISCMELYIGPNTSIHSGNNVIGQGIFTIGESSRIINNHFFDLWNNITIGNRTWIAGKESQFWTHGSLKTKNNTKDLSIKIGDDVYVGSASLFAPGTQICDVNLIGLGSVVNGNFLEKNTLIAGNPAHVIKNNIDWRVNW